MAQRNRRSYWLLLLAALLGFAAVGLFWASSPSISPDPHEQPNEESRDRVASGVFVAREPGVELVLLLRPADLEEVTRGEPGMTVLAAWPAEWERPPLILITVAGETDAAGRLGAGDGIVVCDDDNDCSGPINGQIVEHTGDALRYDDADDVRARQFQVVLDLVPADPTDQNLELSDLHVLGRTLRMSPAEILGVENRADEMFVGTALLPVVPRARTERDGSQSRVNLPYIDTSGYYGQSLCISTYQCDGQEESLRRQLRSDLTETQIAPLLVKNQPTDEEDRWVSDHDAFVFVDPVADWSPIGLTPPRVADWPDLIYDYNDAIRGTDNRHIISVTLESKAESAKERGMGFAGSIAAALAIALAVLGVENYVREPSTRRPAEPSQRTVVGSLVGIALLLMIWRGRR